MLKLRGSLFPEDHHPLPNLIAIRVATREASRYGISAQMRRYSNAKFNPNRKFRATIVPDSNEVSYPWLLARGV